MNKSSLFFGRNPHRFTCFISIAGVILLIAGCDRSKPAKKSKTSTAATQPAKIEPNKGYTIEEAAKEIKKFVHKKENFSIEFPSAWKFEKVTDPSVIVQVTSTPDSEQDPFLENVYIIKKRVIEGTTLDLHINYLRQNIATVANQGQLEESNEMEVNGQRCAWLVALYSVNNTRCKSIRYCFLRGQDLFEVTCTSVLDNFDGYRPAFDKIAKSFRFL